MNLCQIIERKMTRIYKEHIRAVTVAGKKPTTVGRDDGGKIGKEIIN